MKYHFYYITHDILCLVPFLKVERQKTTLTIIRVIDMIHQPTCHYLFIAQSEEERKKNPAHQ